MSGSGKGLLGLWLYRSGDQEWAVKGGSPLHKPEVERLVPLHKPDERLVIIIIPYIIYLFTESHPFN